MSVSTSPIKTRSYTFALTVEDTPNIAEVISIVEQFPKFAYILHDRDLKPDGTPKKDHYHFYVDFPSPRALTSIARDLNIPPNFIQKVHSKTAILTYLTHAKQPEKYQYDILDVKANFVLEDELEHRSLDVLAMYKDLQRLKAGLLSSRDFIKLYLIGQNLSFSTIFRTIDTLSNYESDIRHKPPPPRKGT